MDVLHRYHDAAGAGEFRPGACRAERTQFRIAAGAAHFSAEDIAGKSIMGVVLCLVPLAVAGAIGMAMASGREMDGSWQMYQSLYPLHTGGDWAAGMDDGFDNPAAQRNARRVDRGGDIYLLDNGDGGIGRDWE